MSKEVSWQSAFWGLVTIALNTMVQPSGEVLGFPSRSGFVLRSSPIVCALDTIYTITVFIKHVSVLKSPRQAARRVLHDRFSDSGPHTDSLTRFRHNTVVRLLVFVLSTLTGVVKIYGMHNVPWTKIWASMLWSSFVILELLLFIAGKDRSKRSAAPKGPRYLYDFEPGPFTFISTAWSLICTNFSVILLFSAVLAFGSSENRHHRVSTILELIVLPHSLIPLFRYRPPQQLLILEAALVCLMLGVSLYGYSKLYDPAGTIKPAWTEQLG